MAAAKVEGGRRRRRKLVLHFDVNETIMIGDPAGGDTFEDCLNKTLAKNAFIRPRPTGDDTSPFGRWGEWAWHDGSPLDPEMREAGSAPPPILTAFEWPEGCVPLYTVRALKKAHAKTFTQPGSPGSIYRDLFEAMERALRVPTDGGEPVDPRLVGSDGVHYIVLPAFFHTLGELARQGRDFAVIIRTFGTDGPEIAEAINAWAEGKHPVPHLRDNGVRELALPRERLWKGTYDPADGSFRLTSSGAGADATGAGGEAEADAVSAGAAKTLDEAAVMQLFESDEVRCMAIQDDYGWWSGHGQDPSTGKPLWFSPYRAFGGGGGGGGGGSSSDEEVLVHPIFFDDNIKNDAFDSIVSVRASTAPGRPFAALAGEAIRRLQGIVLVRCPTLEAIQHHDWFLRQIAEAERRMDEDFATAAQQDAILNAPQPTPPPRE